MTPATFVVIDSNDSNAVFRLVISELDRATMRAAWYEPDVLISRLNHLPWIGRALSWAELTRAQIQTLIALHITIRNETPEQDAMLSAGLKLAITAIIVHLEEDTGWSQHLRIKHYGPLHLEVDILMTIGVKMEIATPPKATKMKIVVDNT